MYIPKHFKEKDTEQLVEFMREYNFAAIINYTKEKILGYPSSFYCICKGEQGNHKISYG